MSIPNNFNFLHKLNELAEAVSSSRNAPNLQAIEKELRNEDPVICEKLENIRQESSVIYQKRREEYLTIEKENFQKLSDEVIPYIDFPKNIAEKLFKYTYTYFDYGIDNLDHVTSVVEYLEKVAKIINKKDSNET